MGVHLIRRVVLGVTTRSTAARGMVALLIAAGALALAASPATAAVFLTVSPISVPAGFSVHVAGNCGTSVTSATISSAAFISPVTVVPRLGLFTATAVVAPATPAATYPVTARCAGGTVASASLQVTAVGPTGTGVATPTEEPTTVPTTAAPSVVVPVQGPATGAGGAAGGGAALLLGGGLAVLGAMAFGGYAWRRRQLG